MKSILIVAFASVLLVGCGKGGDNEPYTGVPKDGRACMEAYKLPVNVGKCVQQEGRH
ncbi:hypothetical protein D3C87_1777680 [compost metagenome]